MNKYKKKDVYNYMPKFDDASVLEEKKERKKNEILAKNANDT